MKKQRLYVALGASLAIKFFFVAGPRLIQKIHSLCNSESAMLANRKEYSRLEQMELRHSDPQDLNTQKSKYKLHLWFYARGFPIDEGDGCDGSIHLWRPWQQLIDYWRGDDGSRFYE